MKLMMDGYIPPIMCCHQLFFMLHLAVAVLIYNLEESRAYKEIYEHLETKTKERGGQIIITKIQWKKYRRNYVPFRLINRETEVKGLLAIVHKLKSVQCLRK